MNEWAVLAGLSCLVLPVCLGSLMWFLFSTSSARLTIIRWPHLSSDCFCLVAIRSKGHQLAWFLSAPCGLSCSTGPDWTSQGGFRSIILWCCQPFPEKECFLEKIGPIEKHRGAGSEPCWGHPASVCAAGVSEDIVQHSWLDKPSRLAEGLGRARQGDVLWFDYLAEKVTFTSFSYQHGPLPPSPHAQPPSLHNVR